MAELVQIENTKGLSAHRRVLNERREVRKCEYSGKNSRLDSTANKPMNDQVQLAESRPILEQRVRQEDYSA